MVFKNQNAAILLRNISKIIVLKFFRTGVVEYDKKITVRLNEIFICNAPAKAFIKGIKGHNAYFGCGNCIQEPIKQCCLIDIEKISH